MSPSKRYGNIKTRRNRVMVAALLSVLVMIVLTACSAPALKGSALGKTPSPLFSLNDQRGAGVALADMRGKVVVLTFLYTHCPDECPLIAEHLRAAADQLGDAMQNVAFVAISVDPENDTPIAVQTFLQDHRLDGRLRYLVGTRAQLAPVWAAYSVAAQPSPLRQNEFLVSHSTRLVVIDQNGNQRVNLDSDFEPADLVFDVRALLAE